MSPGGPRRIGVLGAGPGGLYFALLAKKADPSREVVVVERNAPDATFGWGVVFSDETMGALRDADRETYQRILDSFARWGAIDIRFRGETVRSRGHVFSGTPRRGLLMILRERCLDLGVRLEFGREVPSLEAFAEEGFDLIVAADGLNSLTRRQHAELFQPSEEVHRTKYVWYGTDLVFDAFTFIFRDTPHGMFQVHAYPFDAGTSTFIVETLTSTWERAGLAEATEQESMEFCRELFAEELDGHALLSNRSLWTSFVTLRCGSWHAGNVVLLGDAVHTAHFTIGSGTKLAMEDSIALASALDLHGDDLERALTDYELERQPSVDRIQEAARESASYFENVERYAAFEPLRFAFNLLTRSGRITHLELEKRDPSFVARVDAAFAGGSAGSLVAPPPVLAPLGVRGMSLANRVAVAADLTAPGGTWETAAASGAALLMVDGVAVSPEGRATVRSPGLWSDEQAEGWKDLASRLVASEPVRQGVVLTHAGRRAAMRPASDGVDRPLRGGAWTTVGPSAIPLTPRHPAPTELEPDGIARIAGDFASAAGRAAAWGSVSLVVVDAAHGHLLASFISPLTNHRTDAYGGSLANRMRFPLEVFERVRAVWPSDLPAGVRLTCSDMARGGFDADDAVVVARALRDLGCDLIEVAAGQTVHGGQPDYRRLFLVPFADRIRGEVGIVTMVGGSITKPDDANTILAAGRADLVVVDPRIYAV